MKLTDFENYEDYKAYLQRHYGNTAIGNSISSDDWSRDEGSDNNISGFDMDDMENMEREYEMSYYKHPYKSHSSRKMANICCNILVNGNFNPDDKTDYLSHE